MQTLIYKKSCFFLPHHLQPANFFSSRAPENHNVPRIHPQNCHYALKSKISTSCSGSSAQLPSYGGWDDFQLGGERTHSGESGRYGNFLNSFGIGDKKNVFVYLFGFVCALAISRVKISSIIVFPACAVVFAVGFLVGLVKGGQWEEVRANGDKVKLGGEMHKSFMEELSILVNNLSGYDANILNVKNSIRRGIECNQVTVIDLEEYADVLESAHMYFVNAMDVVESVLGKQDKVDGLDHESGRRRKKSNENVFVFSQYFDVLFGGTSNSSKQGKMKGSGKKEVMDVDVNKQKLPNIIVASGKERDLNSLLGGNLENKNASMLDNSLNNTVRGQCKAENFVDTAGLRDIGIENEKWNVAGRDDTAREVFDQTIYSYRNKTSRLVENQRVQLKDYQDETETTASQNDSYDSVDVSISMDHVKTTASRHQLRHETLNRNYSYFESAREDRMVSPRYSFKDGMSSLKKQPSFANEESANENMSGSSPSSVLGRDLEFNNYLAEADNLLKEAKRSLAHQLHDLSAENALHKSATLLSKAIDIRPMSLVAVGQLGNTYLLHGELKLRMSRELRSLIARNDRFSIEERMKLLSRFDSQLADGDKMTSALVNVCEECEELLIKAGRKYKLALSIDGNDMRALYNWGLALSFRAQLLADIGPSAAHDADKVFLAAIDKFDAMMSKSNVCAPDALFKWGAALQHRSRLRPSRSREKVKLLQQARRLYEDALHMDSGNPQILDALSSCVSELDYLYS